MRRDGIRLSRALRFFFYGVFGALFTTGVAWWFLQARLAQPGDEATPSNAIAPWLMRGHGAAAMIALVILGVLYPLHIVRGWHARRNRSSGASVVAAVVVLIISGYLLYYSGGETTRSVSSQIHLWLGLAFPIIILFHVWIGRRLRKPAQRR